MSEADPTDSFLPHFCDPPAVVAVAVVGQTVALALALYSLERDFWPGLFRLSLLVQWLGLGGIALLCLARPLLARQPPLAAGVFSWLLLVAGALGLGVAALATGLVPAGEPPTGFLIRTVSIAAIVAALLLRYLYVQHQWRLRVVGEARARVEALQARIRPHFLFNTLNTVAGLARLNPGAAERAVEDLADLLRASLREGRERITVDEELAIIRHYLNIEYQRLGRRLRVEWSVEEGCGATALPPLLFQPLVENAVYHGIEPRADGGTIRIGVAAEGASVLLTVENPLPTAGSPPTAGNRMAMENIRQRLAALYGRGGALECNQEGGWYRVVLRIPRHEGER